MSEAPVKGQASAKAVQKTVVGVSSRITLRGPRVEGYGKKRDAH